MPEINICSTVGQNTGGIGCDPKMGVPKKMLPGNASVDSSTLLADGAMATWLLGKINQAQGASDKIFPFPLIEGNSDQSEAPTIGTLGYGLKIKLKDGLPAYSFQVRCGESQFRRLRAFDGVEMPVQIIDDKNRLWGTVTSAGIFSGFAALIMVTGNTMEDGTAVEKTTATIEISLKSATEFYDRKAWFDNIFENDYKGLNSFQLAKVGAVSGTTKFEAKIAKALLSGQRTVVNLADFYAALLAAVGNWTVVSATAAQIAAGVTPSTAMGTTGVTYNAADKTWSVVFTAAAYAAIASGDTIRVNLASPSVLYAAGITGVEGLYIDVLKP